MDYKKTDEVELIITGTTCYADCIDEAIIRALSGNVTVRLQHEGVDYLVNPFNIRMQIKETNNKSGF